VRLVWPALAHRVELRYLKRRWTWCSWRPSLRRWREKNAGRPARLQSDSRRTAVALPCKGILSAHLVFSSVRRRLECWLRQFGRTKRQAYAQWGNTLQELSRCRLPRRRKARPNEPRAPAPPALTVRTLFGSRANARRHLKKYASNASGIGRGRPRPRDFSVRVLRDEPSPPPSRPCSLNSLNVTHTPNTPKHARPTADLTLARCKPTLSRSRLRGIAPAKDDGRGALPRKD